MNKIDYKPRIADRNLADLMEAMGAVLIEGPKWCGKTTTAEHAANSSLYLSNPMELRQAATLIDINPQLLLSGDTPRLIDEWQEFPQLWDAIRYEVDHRHASGQFLLTGSAVPNDNKLKEIHHTGTGRIARMTMRPMSLWESGDSNGAVSIADLFKGNLDIALASPDNSLQEVAYWICRGGWPETVNKKDHRTTLIVAQEYLKAVVTKDISRVNSVMKSPERAKRLMRSYARHQGGQAPYSTIVKDISANETQALSVDTVKEYIDALKRIFVIEDVTAWNPNLRSKTAIRSSDTHYYVDPSIATAALEIGPDDLMADLNTMGLMLETLAIRDLRCYADANNGTIYHYRDGNGLECDAVMHLYGGRYALVEIKIGGERLIEEGAKNLLRLASKIDTSNMNAPSFLMVLTAVGRYAYRRKDGVLVVPIGCLKD